MKQNRDAFRKFQLTAAVIGVSLFAGVASAANVDEMAICAVAPPVAEVTTATVKSAANASVTSATTVSELVPCAELPHGQLTDADLKRLVPDRSPGRVRIAWKTESQEETYGFNIMRSDKKDGPYHAINKRVIPGEGTSNVPKLYCYEDVGVNRGQVYYYQIEEITNAGVHSLIEGTAATRIQVKTVPEEREWLKKKAAK